MSVSSIQSIITSQPSQSLYAAQIHTGKADGHQTNDHKANDPASPGETAKKPYSIRPSHDEYIPGDAESPESENKTKPVEESEKDPDKGPGNDEEHKELCTTNTDKVDAEIRALRKKLKQLKQQAAHAAGDPAKASKLEREINNVGRELSTKDNDAYRKQHAVYTSHSPAN